MALLLPHIDIVFLVKSQILLLLVVMVAPPLLLLLRVANNFVFLPNGMNTLCQTNIVQAVNPPLDSVDSVFNAIHTLETKICAKMTQVFVDRARGRSRVRGILVAGHGPLKDSLVKHKDLDPIVRYAIQAMAQGGNALSGDGGNGNGNGFAAVGAATTSAAGMDVSEATVDVAYDGMAGFREAVALAREKFVGCALMDEARSVSELMQLLATTNTTNDGNSTDNADIETMCIKAVVGVKETMAALELGVVSKLLVWDESPIVAVGVRDATAAAPAAVVDDDDDDDDLKKDENFSTDERIVWRFYEDQAAFEAHNNGDDEVVAVKPLLDYLMDEGHLFEGNRVQLNLVSNATAEGFQFVQGLGGIGGVLSYALPLEALGIDDDTNFDQEEVDDDDFWSL
jgi:peptide subunit release factor 1 (eRF1)